MRRAGLAVAALSLAGCVHQMIQDRIDAQRAANAPLCVQRVQQLEAAYCKPDLLANQRPEFTAGLADQVQQQRSAIAAYCPDPASQQELSRLDGCIAQLRASQAKLEQDAMARRMASRDGAAKAKADPAYQASAQRFHRADEDERLACESAENARKDASPNLELWQKRCDEAKLNLEASRAAWKAQLDRFGVDVRDASVLGL